MVGEPKPQGVIIMAHFTVEQIRDLATAYFNGRDTYRKYPSDWFNGGEDLYRVRTEEVELDGQKTFIQRYEIISLDDAIALYANDEDECYYNETMNNDCIDFFIMMGDEDFNCDEVYYDYFKECGVFLNPAYLQAIIEPWHNTIGASIIDSIRKEYYHYAKER